MQSLFFYGSLRDRELLEIVLDRPVDPSDFVEARAEGYRALRLEDEDYPHLAAVEGGVAEGVLVTGLSETDMARLTYFEEAEYGLAPIRVQSGDATVETRYFLATPKVRPAGDVQWSFSTWAAEARAVAVEAARELMAHFEITPVEDMDTIWPGIMIRARMRARARAAEPRWDGLRTPRTGADVEQVAIGRPYTRYFAIEEHALRHRQFDGGMGPAIRRTVISTGDAVTVLPYDASRDEVLLIEQFRAAPHARGDRAPWLIEVIAGRIDKDGDAEATARREAAEEAGLTLGRIELVAGYYSSPGFACEHVTSYVAEADLGGAGGVFGVATENEDIRAFAVPFETALAGIASGEIANAPAVMSLFWLQLHCERLRAEWS